MAAKDMCLVELEIYLTEKDAIGMDEEWKFFENGRI